MPRQHDLARPAGAGRVESIVVGVDGEDGGWEALALARRLARADDAGLVVVCAYPVIAAAHAALLWPRIRDERAAQAVLDRARGRLEDHAHAAFVAASGSTPGTVLQRVAVERDAHLISVGSSRRALVGRVLGGDVVMQTLDHPPCPVAVAACGVLETTAPFANIGVAVDGTEQSLAAVRWARALTPDPFVARTIEPINVSGPVAPALADITPELDLLAIGTHGRGPIGRLLQGGVAAAVAGCARCPVVAVPFAPVGEAAPDAAATAR
jgi:nucleotide-binding universal stress UspA family protein